MKPGTITEDTAFAILTAYREIKSATTLLADIEQAIADRPSSFDLEHRYKRYQLGVPSGESSTRIFDVRPELAKSVVLAHIAEQERRLVEANERARIELGAVS